MAKCSGCTGDRCSCVITAGPNIIVTGAGTTPNPYVIEGEGGGGGGGSRVVGEIVAFGGSVAPAGWLVCNGQTVSRATYAALFAVVGTTYGAGDGASTFALPDLAGRFALGADGTYTLGSEGGAASVTLGVTNIPLHHHSINHDHNTTSTSSAGAHDHTTGSSDVDGGGSGQFRRASPTGRVDNNALIQTAGAHTHSVDTPAYVGNSGDTGSGTAFGIMPLYTAVTFLIKT